MVRLAGLTLLISLSAVSSALAQDPATRAEADRQRREEKAREVRPYEPRASSARWSSPRTSAIFIIDREGFYPKFGSLTTGSGFAYGIGFRDRDLFENKGILDIWTAGAHAEILGRGSPAEVSRAASKRLLLETWVSRRDYPKENFFGLGPDSNRDDQLGLCDPYRISLAGGRASADLVRPRRRRSRVSDACR